MPTLTQGYEDERQQSINPIPPPIPAPIPEGPDEDFFRFRINGLDILEEIKHQLRGEVLDERTGRYEQVFDRWMNDEGINKVLHIIYTCGINKNTFLGNLTKDEIMFKCRVLKKDLSLLLYKKYRDYGVKREMRSLLIKSIVNPIHSALSRSEDGKEADQISTAAQRHEIYQHQEQQRDRSSLRSIMPFFRGR